MKKIIRFCTFAVCSAAAIWGALPAQANDEMFPAAPAAKSTVDYDGRGFLINGKRTFIASGSLHYARVPRALWRDRLMKFKRAGINTVETYVFWNIHEPKPGQFNFKDGADLDAFLSLAQSLGMYAIVRVGPYYCAEWDFGGYPVWLRNVPGLEVRVDNEPFKKAVSDYFDKILPIVKAHQIHKGGNVVLVQLENEHPLGWGTEMPNGYFRFLRDKYVKAGLEVPYFFSGLHHSADPAGNRSWDSKGRKNPWFSTEFWPGWYDIYGPLDPQRFRQFDRGTWKIIAYGGNGYNYYMLHGGTNLDYTNNNEDASSYDYGAAVGQAGDLRPIYSRFKRAAMFATSFAPILENSENADAKFQSWVADTKLKVTARQSDAGTLIFLDNPGNAPVQTSVSAPDGGAATPVTLEAGEIMPVVQNFPLAPGVKIAWAPTRVLGTLTQGDQTTLFVYGQAGTPASVAFTCDSPVQTKGSSLLTQTGNTVTFKTTVTGGAQDASFTAGTEKIRVVALNPELADRTWFVENGNQKAAISGLDYVGDVSYKNGQWQVTTERPWDSRTSYPVTVYGTDVKTLPARPIPAVKRLVSLPLSDWQQGDGTLPAQPTYNDAGWLADVNPLQMGSDNDITCYGWYRSSLSVAQGGTYSLAYEAGGDNLMVFVDGKPVTSVVAPQRSLSLSLTPGTHAFAVFASHDGRDKLFNYLGPVSDRNVKGLKGNIALRQAVGGEQTVSGWKVQNLTAAPPATEVPANLTNARDYTIGTDAFDRKNGYAWFTAPLPTLGSEGTKIIHFDSIDDEAVVYLNGKKIGEHKGWDQSFDLPTGDAWKSDGPNLLTVLIRNNDNSGGIDKPVTISSAKYLPIKNWKMRGGPKGGSENIAYKPLAGGVTAMGPMWYRTTFTAPGGVGTIWRVKTRGLSRGSVWLNGHNLGRYPEKVPVDGMYLPECWLNKGKNTIEIYDEEGKAPTQVVVEAESAASRDVLNYTVR